MFPVKFGNESDVSLYSKTLIKGENQLLITERGNLFITLGNGTYLECSGNNLRSVLLVLEESLNVNINDVYTKLNNAFTSLQAYVDTLSGDVVIDIENLHFKTTLLEADLLILKRNLDALHVSLTELGDGLGLLTNDVDEVKANLSDLTRKVSLLESNTSDSFSNLLSEIKTNYVTKNEVTDYTNVTINNGEVYSTMPLQQAIDYIMQKIVILTPLKCGTFKAGIKTCGFGHITEKAICGTFKAGTLVCGRGILPKTICGSFKVGEQKCGS